MASFDDFLDNQVSSGRLSFTREELLRALSASSNTLTHSLSKLARQGRIANPRPGFYLILRPEDEGAPDPRHWIRALMKHQETDYRVSLLSAAQFHGASTEAPALQVVVPHAMRDLAIGRHRLEFTAQSENAFIRTNRSEWLGELETESGTAKVAGVELTLLDCATYFHKARGISVVGQIVRELGAKASARRLVTLARACDNGAVRRLGYLLELAGHEAQAAALEQFAREARAVKLDPKSAEEPTEMSGRWKIAINHPVKREP